MFVFYLLIFVLTLIGIKYRKKGFFDDYIEKPQCNAIKGIFILVVFMRHVVPYIEKAGYQMPLLLDKYYTFVNGQIGQLLVVMFLFYSGYGVMVSISRKGESYINDIPKKRVLSTFINFDVAVTLFLLMDFAFDIRVDTAQYFLARFGWEGIGNSNWYIFIIMVCYLLTYFCYKLSHQKGALLLFVMSFAVIAILFMLKQPHWYNTLLCYPVGMVYAINRKKIEAIIKKRYLLSLLLFVFMFVILHIGNLRLPAIINAYTYNVEGVVFALSVVFLSMKIKIGNKALYWLGVNLFPLYIYQRMPMVAVRELEGSKWISDNPYFFVLVCLAGMLIITSLYKYWKISI